MKHALVLLALLSVGCSTVSEQIRDGIFYRRDIQVTVNGAPMFGAGVAPRAATYHVTGTVKGTFDSVLLRSCHREAAAELHESTFGYDYTPQPGLEDNRACPLKVEGVEQKKGRDAWAFIDFQDAAHTLLAAVECNGGVEQYPGVSVCQAHVGLLQRIDFQVPVIADFDADRCKIPEAADGIRWEFVMPRGQCTILFMERGGAHRKHRFTTLGYEDIVVRDF